MARKKAFTAVIWETSVRSGEIETSLPSNLHSLTDVLSFPSLFCLRAEAAHVLLLLLPALFALATAPGHLSLYSRSLKGVLGGRESKRGRGTFDDVTIAGKARAWKWECVGPVESQRACRTPGPGNCGKTRNNKRSRGECLQVMAGEHTVIVGASVGRGLPLHTCKHKRRIGAIND